MQRDPRRYLVVVALLGAALMVAAIRSPRPPAAAQVAPGTGESGPGYVLFADTEGWYQITPREVAVVSPYDLGLKSLPGSLPMELGEWRGEELKLGPEIARWFDNPEVAFERAYKNPDGDVVWLALFGHRGPRSFRLFEHTPTSCYPLSGWAMLNEVLDSMPLNRGKMYAQQGLAQNGTQQLVVLYWYLWDNPQRDPQNGVVSIRISAPILKRTPEGTLNMLKTRFIRHLFTEVIPWHRF